MKTKNKIEIEMNVTLIVNELRLIVYYDRMMAVIYNKQINQKSKLCYF